MPWGRGLSVATRPDAPPALVCVQRGPGAIGHGSLISRDRIAGYRSVFIRLFAWWLPLWCAGHTFRQNASTLCLLTAVSLDVYAVALLLPLNTIWSQVCGVCDWGLHWYLLVPALRAPSASMLCRVALCSSVPVLAFTASPHNGAHHSCPRPLLFSVPCTRVWLMLRHGDRRPRAFLFDAHAPRAMQAPVLPLCSCAAPLGGGGSGCHAAWSMRWWPCCWACSRMSSGQACRPGCALHSMTFKTPPCL